MSNESTSCYSVKRERGCAAHQHVDLTDLFGEASHGWTRIRRVTGICIFVIFFATNGFHQASPQCATLISKTPISYRHPRSRLGYRADPNTVAVSLLG